MHEPIRLLRVVAYLPWLYGALYTLNLKQWKYLRFSEFSLNLRLSLIQIYGVWVYKFLP